MAAEGQQNRNNQQDSGDSAANSSNDNADAVRTDTKDSDKGTSLSPEAMYRDILAQWANQKPGDFKSASDYATAVRQWLWQCYYWQNISSSFPYYLLNCLQQSPTQSSQPPRFAGTPLFHQFNQIRNQNIPLVGGIPQNGTRPVNQQNIVHEFLVPPLWKRFVAEFIDFLILFLLKLVITFVAVDFFNIIDLEKYNLAQWPTEILTDYKLALEMTSDIVLLELIHKLVVCVFEAICLHRGTVGIGGATPGKNIMGIKVVSCESVLDLGNNRVHVQPARDIGFSWALVRSIIKNLSMAFFFPVCFTLFFFQYNRTVYDIVCNCIVVEDCVPRNNNNNNNNNINNNNNH